ncbi:MAG TPA: NAD(P)-dependent oxidoreductase [Terriglobia bacterium]|nr:NAD(P)-dependent oxidoreductase [Terriglobia bacterium]
MKVLFLGTPTMLHPWYDDVLEIAAGRWPIQLFDPGKNLAEQLEGVSVVVDQGGMHGTRELISASREAGVKLWQVLGTGLDHTDVGYILEQGIPLANTPGQFSAIALAEHALFLMLLFAKRMVETQNSIRQQILANPMNEELSGKTLGLLGLGASGRELAKRAKVLGMRILAIDIVKISDAVRQECGLAFSGSSADLPQVLEQCDYLSLHMPLTSKTRHMINRSALEKMKSTAVVINVARGEIVDEGALADALKSGRIRGAGLDVFPKEPVDPSHPLLQLPNLVATPHVAGVTFGTSRRRAQAVVENLERITQGLPPLYQVTQVE